jgi:dTDP-4-dehydrorhamnose 3,5-epimerase
MEIRATALPGVYLVVPVPREDVRGFFARTWCQDTFAERGLCGSWVQSSVSYNRRRGTLRGMHYQAAPAEEIKLVRCTQGAIYDVLVDLRLGLPSYGQWLAVELTASNRYALYVPGGVAHGFQTLCDDTEVFYEISTRYRPELQRGVRWDDPALGIIWPDCAERIIAERDCLLPRWQPA